jgi:hypothetical protein
MCKKMIAGRIFGPKMENRGLLAAEVYSMKHFINSNCLNEACELWEDFEKFEHKPERATGTFRIYRD